MRLKELFTQASRDKESAIQSRDQALIERDQLREENQRLKEQRLQEQIQPAISYAGTDSGYESMSWTCDATRTSSYSDASGFPSLTANAPLQEVAARTPLADVRRTSVWDLEETRGFASDDPMPDLPVVKVDSTVQDKDSGQVIAKLSTELPAIELDYDELGLDFILT